MKLKFLTSICAVSGLFLTSCSTPITQESSNVQQKTAAGAGLGAIAGYYLGKQSDRRGEGAALGAAAGGALGYGLGKNQDAQR